MFVIVIGRGHGGTRLASQTLSESGVYMGPVNESGDLLPPERMYDAARIAGRYVRHLGGFMWDFSKLLAADPPEDFQRLLRDHLKPVLSSSLDTGWKLPEAVLALPWIIKMFPEAHYIYWYRGLLGNTSGYHNTDDLRKFNVPAEGNLSESWVYQRKMMAITPKPERVIHVDYEKFVLEQDETLARMTEFLGIPLAKVQVIPQMVNDAPPSPERFPGGPSTVQSHLGKGAGDRGVQTP